MSEQINIEQFNSDALKQLTIPFAQYTKEATSAITKIKETITQSISNGYTFSNTNAEISKKISIVLMKESDEMLENDTKYIRTTEDCTVYPESNDIQQWLIDTIKKITEYKPLNPMALENMKKKGLSPKKQIGEMLIFLVVPSRTHINIAIYIPSIYQDGFSIENFISSSMKDYIYDITVKDNYGFVNYPHDSPMKERDTISRLFFEQLKKVGIYKDDTDNEEILFASEFAD